MLLNFENERTMKKSLLFLFVSFFYTVSAQNAIRIWDYPYKPGSEKWKSLKSHQEMVNICQIPEDVIHKLTTEELVKICLDYPLFFTLTAFNNMQEGFEQNKREFNGFLELFGRNDAGKELLKLYSEISPGEVMSKKSDLDKGNFKFRIFYLEILLAQNDLLSALSKEEQRVLLSECLDKTIEKNDATYSNFQLQTTYLIMARILLLNQFNEFLDKYRLNQSNYDWFIYSIKLTGSSLIKEIETTTRNYLSKTI